MASPTFPADQRFPAAKGLVLLVDLARHDPALLRRRTEAGISYERETAQKIIVFLLFVVCTALVVVSPLDFRFGWSSVPWYVSVIGDALIAFSFYIFYLVSKVNTYAAANVRVEEGQQVVSNGMYALVRHPMYLRGTFPRDRYSVRTRFVVGAFARPSICTGAVLSHSQRRESSYARSSRLHRIHPEGPIIVSQR